MKTLDKIEEMMRPGRRDRIPTACGFCGKPWPSRAAAAFCKTLDLNRRDCEAFDKKQREVSRIIDSIEISLDTANYPDARIVEMARDVRAQLRRRGYTIAPR